LSDLLNRDKKVVLSCTSSVLALTIKAEIEANYPNTNIKFYDGNDAKKYNDKSMAKIKSEDFKDVHTAWANVDLLIYTGTLTAGISFEINHFDCLIGIFAKMTASPLAFT
jgi:hypothetical protein